MPETKMDEKQAQPQPAPGTPSPSKGDSFLLLARVWVALLGVTWAGTILFLLTNLSFLGQATVPVFRDTGGFSGSCDLVCHGVLHDGASYP